MDLNFNNEEHNDESKIGLLLLGCGLVICLCIGALCFVLFSRHDRHKDDHKRHASKSSITTSITGSESFMASLFGDGKGTPKTPGIDYDPYDPTPTPTPTPTPSPTPTPYFDTNKGYLYSIEPEQGTLIIDDIYDYYTPDELPYEISFETESFVDKYDDYSLNFDVDYPVLTSKDGKNMDKVNEVLKSASEASYQRAYEEVNEKVEKGVTSSDIDYSGTSVYQVTYANEDLISVVYNQHYSLGSSSEGHYDFVGTTVNVKTGEVYDITDILTHDDDFDQLYYDKLEYEASSYFSRLYSVDTDILSETLDSDDWVDGAYNTDFFLNAGGVSLAFSYYDDPSGYAGWITVNYSIDDVKDYMTDSKMWDLFTL